MSLVIEMHPVNFVLEILQIHIIIIINNAFENALHRDLKALYIAKLKKYKLNYYILNYQNKQKYI